MLHAAKGLCHLGDDRVVHQAFHRQNSSHIIFHIMLAGKQDIFFRQNGSSVQADHISVQADTVFRLAQTAEPTSLSVAGKGGGNGIIQVQNQGVPCPLEFENILLRLHIFVHVLMDIQVVGRKVRHHRHIGAATHIHQLEGAELHHCEIILFHPVANRKQRRTDIAAQPYLLAGSLQQFGNEGGGGSLTVRAGDRDGAAGAKLKENLHLAGDLRAFFPKGHQSRVLRVHTGGAENNICGQTVQVAIAYPQAAAQLLQLQHLSIQLFSGSAVTAGDGTTVAQQQPHQRAVADTQSQNRNIFSFQRAKVCIEPFRHKSTSRHFVFL